MSLWAKLHVDILGDPKLMRAARKGAKGLILTPWLIAFAKQANDEGRLTVAGEPAEPVDISALLPGVTARAVAESLASLKRIGVLVTDDDGALRFAAWEKRSVGGKPSDQKGAVLERVHRLRQRRRNADTPDSVTPAVTPDCNALQPEIGNATEKEVETEQEQRQTIARGKREPPEKPAEKRAVWLPLFQAAWRERFEGELPVGKSVRALKKLCDANDPGEVLRRWHIYLDSHHGQGQYANAEKFSSTYGQWSQAPPAGTNGKHDVGGVANRTFANARRALEGEP